VPGVHDEHPAIKDFLDGRNSSRSSGPAGWLYGWFASFDAADQSIALGAGFISAAYGNANANPILNLAANSKSNCDNYALSNPHLYAYPNPSPAGSGRDAPALLSGQPD
jgi:hypothetical protein